MAEGTEEEVNDGKLRRTRGTQGRRLIGRRGRYRVGQAEVLKEIGKINKINARKGKKYKRNK